MSIFTRKGDHGTTSLAGGTQVDKDDLRVEAYGTLDELNSLVGLLKSLTGEKELEDIQRKIFCIGGYIACENKTISGITTDDVECIEHWIEETELALDPLKRFVVPGGIESASICHVCRTVCRRSERRMISLRKSLEEQMDDAVFQYINRLSDYFFVLARKLNKNAGVGDIVL